MLRRVCTTLGGRLHLAAAAGPAPGPALARQPWGEPPARAFAAAAATGDKGDAIDAEKILNNWSAFMKKKAAQDDAAAAAPATPAASPAAESPDLSFLLPTPANQLAQLRAMEGEEGSGGVGGRLLPQATDGYRKSGIELAQIRVNPFRLYYPGQTYTPEDFDPHTVKVVPHASQKLAKARPDPAQVERALDWRNLRLLDSFVATTGRLSPRRHTRLPARLQRKMQRHVKLARTMGLLSYTGKLPEFQKLANPYTPV